jgi:Ca2+:H+ antiporter
MAPATRHNPPWTWIVPILAALALGLAFLVPGMPGIVPLLVAGLCASVVASVHHAEVVALKVGEPFGTLVLALAVTAIEVALIVTMMLAGGEANAGLPRDTVFAAVMLILNGIIGLSLIAGSRRHAVQRYRIDGVTAALATLTAIVVVTLVLPNYTAARGPFYSHSQLAFISVVTLVLFAAFTLFQTVRHRDYFLPVERGDEASHAPPPTGRTAAVSAVLLLLALVAVVGLSKALTPMVELAVARLEVPKAVVGIVIATLVLLPEGLAALQAARADRLQTSLNLALGSALASIGLTIPTVAVVSIVLGKPLELGLGEKDTVLLALTLVVGVITLGTGRTTVLQGIVHLVIFAVFLFFAVVP